MEEDNSQNQNEEVQTQAQEEVVEKKEEPKKGGRALMLGLIILVVAIVVAALYFKSSKSKTPSQPMNSDQVSPAQSEENNQSETMPSETEVKDITVEGSEFSYSPSSINLMAGEPVRLTFNNIGTVAHNLVIDELGVTTKTVTPGESDTVEFTPDKSGTFTFYCSIDSHRARGMEGEVMVE
jgi:plastocyanin